MKTSLILFALMLLTRTASAVTAAESVEAGKSVTLPDWAALGTGQDVSGYAAGYGTETGAIELLRENGQGILYAPGRSNADACAAQSDPRCLAVQVVDRAAKAPVTVDPDPAGTLLTGRDSVVTKASDFVDITGSVSASSGTCRPVYETVATNPETNTCEITSTKTAGSLTENSCSISWVKILETASTYQCTVSDYRDFTASCAVPVVLGSRMQDTYVCREGTTAGSTATCPVFIRYAEEPRYEARCTRPLYRATTKSCRRALTVVPSATCTPGTVTTATVSDSAVLGEDGVPGADTLTLSYKCETNEGDFPAVSVSLNGAGVLEFSQAAWRQQIEITRGLVKYTGTLACEAGSCTAGVTAQIYVRTGPQYVYSGELSARLVFTAYRLLREAEYWSESCD